MNPKKCCPPARVMEILGFLYDAVAKRCRLSTKKQTKYINQINVVLESKQISVTNLEKLVGYLTYAAQVSPFGRPFLSVLSSKINPSIRSQSIAISPAMKNALVIQRMILTKNQGLSYDFILGHLPPAKNEWFIDASTNYGCGGIAGNSYFMLKNTNIRNSKFFGHEIKFDDVKIAYRELLSGVIALRYFAPDYPSS